MLTNLEIILTFKCLTFYKRFVKKLNTYPTTHWADVRTFWSDIKEPLQNPVPSAISATVYSWSDAGVDGDSSIKKNSENNRKFKLNLFYKTRKFDCPTLISILLTSNEWWSQQFTMMNLWPEYFTL